MSPSFFFADGFKDPLKIERGRPKRALLSLTNRLPPTSARRRPMQPYNDELYQSYVRKREAGSPRRGAAAEQALDLVSVNRDLSTRAALSPVSPPETQQESPQAPGLQAQRLDREDAVSTPRLTSTLTGVACDFMLTPLGCAPLAAAHGSTRLLEVSTPIAALGTNASLEQPPPDKATAAKNGSFIFFCWVVRTRAGLALSVWYSLDFVKTGGWVGEWRDFSAGHRKKPRCAEGCTNFNSVVDPLKAERHQSEVVWRTRICLLARPSLASWTVINGQKYARYTTYAR